MDSKTVELALNVLGAMTVVCSIVSGLLIYIWRLHTKDLENQKKALSEKIDRTQFEQHRQAMAELKQSFEREIEKLEKRHRDEVEAIRGDLNGVANRLSEVMNRVEESFVTRIEQMGLLLQREIATLTKSTDKQQEWQVDMSKSLSAVREQVASISAKVGG